MKKLILLSLFAIGGTGLYGDAVPEQKRQCCGPQRAQTAMPYTTIVEEEAQGSGSRQQYYYYGADTTKQLNNNRENNDGSLFNRQNIRDLRGNLNRGSLQGTYFNRSATQDAAASNDTFNNANDRALAQKIRDAIKGGWFSKGYEQVTLDVNNGIVTIRGFVATLNDKKNVEDTVKDVDGVNNVNNQLSVQTNNTRNDQGNTNLLYQRNANVDDSDDDEDYDDEDDNDYPQDRAATDSDRQINNRIRDAISNGWFAKKYETIVIRTDKGIVTIEGFVESFDDQRKLNDEIRKVAGVRSVNNNVQVKDKNS